jgi:hypothetical protein
MGVLENQLRVFDAHNVTVSMISICSIATHQTG